VALKQYDVLDRVASTVDANGIALTNTYDNLGRLIKKTYPDGNAESYTYSALGLLAYTNQLGYFVHYGYDVAGRKLAETNANSEVTPYTYSPAGDMLTLVDAKNQTNRWGYDLYGRVTSQVDAAGNTIFTYAYDQNGRMTNRWTAAKGNTYYSYDAGGNLTGVTYPTSPSITLTYDPLNRVTTMIDGVGTSSYSYMAWDAVATEDGPWENDTVTHTFNDVLMPSGWSLAQPNAPPLSLTYAWDGAARLIRVYAPMGTLTNDYSSGVGSATCASTLVKKLSLPNGAYITNTFNTLARLTGTYVKHSSHTNLNYQARRCLRLRLMFWSVPTPSLWR
jgi:YD repeat-containing protein